MGCVVRQCRVYYHETLSFLDSYASDCSGVEAGQTFQASPFCGGWPAQQGLYDCVYCVPGSVFLPVNGKASMGQVPELDGRGL